MKIFKSTSFVLGVAVFVCGSLSGAVAAPLQEPAKIAASDSSPEAKAIKAAFDKLAAAVKAQKIDVASKLMTPEGASEFLGGDLIVAVEFYQEVSQLLASGEAGDDAKELEAALSVIQKWGLDKVELPEDYYDAATEEEFNAADKKARSLVFKAIPDGKLAAAVGEIRAATASFLGDLEPFAGDLGEVELSKDAKSAVAAITFSEKVIKELFGEEAAGEKVPPMFGKFLATKDGWKWNGEDVERTMKAWEAFEGGSRMPEFPIIKDIALTGKTAEGKPVSLKSLKGKVVVIDFWGTWCRPCVAELPTLKKIHEKLNSKGLEIIGVAADDAETLNAFYKKKPLPWNNIVDGEGEIAEKFGIEYYPTTLIVDKAGNHVASNLSGKRLVAKIVELLELDPKEYDEFSKMLKPHGAEEKDAGADGADKEATDGADAKAKAGGE